MHAISRHLPEFDHYFSPYYADGAIEFFRRRRFLEFTILGDKLKNRCLAYLRTHDLAIDVGGKLHDYDLVVTCSDLIIPNNIRHRRMILVQEGMTDPENWLFHLVRSFGLPRYIASTSTTGLSHAYDYFCIASEGYRDLFTRKGVDPARLRVTGMPNFDNCAQFLENDFPHRNFVLVATSDMRETFKYEDRKGFIERCARIANGRQLIFKLHPNENAERATREVKEIVPDALVYPTGNIEHMIANSDVLVTRLSSCVYVGIALGKEVYSDFDIDELHHLAPIQNGGISDRIIADVCRLHIEGVPVPDSYVALRDRTYLRPAIDERAAQEVAVVPGGYRRSS
jgi:hypothetical protein